MNRYVSDHMYCLVKPPFKSLLVIKGYCFILLLQIATLCWFFCVTNMAYSAGHHAHGGVVVERNEG